MNNEELAPVRCGCGGEAVVIHATNSVMIWCNNCGIETRLYDSEAEAVEAWNRAMGGVAKNATTERTAKECAKDARCSERTAKVKDLCGKWGHCECGAYVFRPDAEGWRYCPMCGARLEWK